MVVLQKRSRLVTFRVSAEEHEDLVTSSLKAGARTVAEFARSAALQKAHMVDTTQGGTIQGDLTTLGKTLSELDTTLDTARKRIRELLGPGADRSSNTKHSEPP